MKKLPDVIKEAARNLRKNLTDSEVVMWGFIR
jgi:very-short-patch-repair endonuclease